MVQSTINLVCARQKHATTTVHTVSKYLSKNARYTNHLITFWIEVIHNALEAWGFVAADWLERRLEPLPGVIPSDDSRLDCMRIDCDTGGDATGRLCFLSAPQQSTVRGLLANSASGRFHLRKCIGASVTAFWMFASALACAALSARDGQPSLLMLFGSQSACVGRHSRLSMGVIGRCGAEFCTSDI
jgi:hypothetical protein